MNAMKPLLILTVLIGLGGCAPTSDYTRVEQMPHEWEVEPEYPMGHEHMVSKAMVYEDLADYSRQMQAGGWRIEGPFSAGKFMPGKYFVVLSRPK